MTQQTMPFRLLALADHELFVLTAQHGDRRSGALVSWLTPATLVPDRPRVVTILSIANLTTELIEASGAFLAHLLAADQIDLVPHFGLHSGRTTDKFARFGSLPAVAGLPLLPGTCGWMYCRVVDRVPLGDRVVAIADVIEQKIEAEVLVGRRPLRKLSALSQLDAGIVAQLVRKAEADGERDRALIRHYER